MKLLRRLALLRCSGTWLAVTTAVPLLHAAWAPPEAAQLARLDRALASWNANYDPGERMVRRPFSSPGYHTTLTGGFVHPTRDSLAYAVGLLDTGRPADLERATAILHRVIDLQDQDPASRTHGIWSWFLEEPLPKMSPPDFNWADFNGVSLLQVARDHRARLPADLARKVETSLDHACRAIIKRNVGPGYTNIAIMGAYVTLVTGETLGRPEFRDYGIARLKRFHDHTLENGTFEEYNSPTYTIVALHELSRLQAHALSPEAQRLVAPLVRHAWELLARHFHAPTRQWAGPHSRAYSSLLSAATLAQIQRGTGGRVDFGVDEPSREDLRLPLVCPPDLEPLFRDLPSPRTVTQTFVQRSRTIGTTYLHPRYALGTVNQGDLWNQRRALLLHFGTAAAPGYLHLRLLKNGYDFSSGIFTSAQREGLVVATVHLITYGGDTHISLDKVKNATIRARDLRLRFEFGGPAASTVTVAPPAGDRAAIDAAGLPLHLQVLRARLGTRDGVLQRGGNDKLRWLDVVLHEGDDREFSLASLEEAIVGFALGAQQTPQASASLSAGRLTVTWDDLTVSAPLKPVSRR
ncbi:MAG: hypothetical protein HZC55_19080 [Verrucomicrobia bacterium]|nr:hypothetical protein [Verrucomicrobiota bacterium]